MAGVLREHAKRRPERVTAFVDAHRSRMSGVTLREALRGVEASRKAAGSGTSRR